MGRPVRAKTVPGRLGTGPHGSQGAAWAWGLWRRMEVEGLARRKEPQIPDAILEQLLSRMEARALSTKAGFWIN